MHIASSTLLGDCISGEVRLIGGHDDERLGTREGRLQICFNNAWGTVCNASFGIPDAMVACNQLRGFDSTGKKKKVVMKLYRATRFLTQWLKSFLGHP